MGCPKLLVEAEWVEETKENRGHRLNREAGRTDTDVEKSKDEEDCVTIGATGEQSCRKCCGDRRRN